MSQIEAFGAQSAAEIDADLRSRGADYTPPAIAYECVRLTLSELFPFEIGWTFETHGPVRALDVHAGAGIYSGALVAEWARLGLPREWLHITAVEIDPREREHLEAVDDEVIIGDWRLALWRPARRTGRRVRAGVGRRSRRRLRLRAGSRRARAFAVLTVPARYDLALGNPNFDELRAPKVERGQDAPPGAEKVGDDWYDVARSLPVALLEVATVVALLARGSAWSKDGPGVSVRRACPPARAWDIPGSLRFRAPGSRSPKTGKLYGADQHGYTWWVWRRGHRGPTSMDLMRDFSPAERRWTVRPGT